MHNTEIQRLMHENATMHGLLLWALYHSQGGSSPVGQPIRRALGIGTHDHLTAEQVTEAKQYGAGFPYEVPYHTEDHTLSAHDELLKIHRILLAPGACPAISDDDTLTIRLLKDLIIWNRHQRQMAFGPQIAAMQQSQSDNIVAGVPTHGPSNPPRLRKPGESLEEYRAAMGWSNETPNQQITGA